MRAHLKGGGSGPCKGWLRPPSLPLYWALMGCGCGCVYEQTLILYQGCYYFLPPAQLLQLLFASYSHCLARRLPPSLWSIHLCNLYNCTRVAEGSPILRLPFIIRLASTRASGYTHTNENSQPSKKKTYMYNTPQHTDLAPTNATM